MRKIDRRAFLTVAALSIAGSTVRAEVNSKTAVRVRISDEETGIEMPVDFVGLSYEVQQLATPSFFSSANTGLIAQCKALSSNGVLRLGGNTSEFAYWKPTPASPEPAHPATREVEGEPKAHYYAVTPEAVRNLAGFLRATGWSCLYGIGMGTNTPQRAAEEADFVAQTLGPSLQYFQIGNEADLFSHHLRDPQTWSAKTYLNEWLGFARAIAARVPHAKFGMPDVAAAVSWLTEISEEWPKISNPANVTRLSHHYYFGGPATNPDVNIENLLKPATMDKVQRTADIASSAARSMGVGLRMTEGNTCYRGGKPGVSDVFASALWSADYCLLLARNGYSGVNLHGGTGTSVANSVGGFLPGDVMLQNAGKSSEEIQSHPHPFYTPIATFGESYKTEPVAYGMKFAGALAGGKFLRADLVGGAEGAGTNVSVYGARLPNGEISVILLNKTLDKDVELHLEFSGVQSAAIHLEALMAPTVTSREAHIQSVPQTSRLKAGRYTVMVPRASGMRISLIKN